MPIIVTTETGFRILPKPNLKKLHDPAKPRIIVRKSKLGPIKVSPEDQGYSLDEKTQLILEQVADEARQLEDDETRDLWLDGIETFRASGNIDELIKLTEYRRKVVPLDEFLLGKTYLGIAEAELFPAVREICEALDSDNYIEAVLKGALGYGKSSAANIMLCRIIYKISCMRHPQSTYALQSRSSIIFTIQSVRLSTAKKAVFDELGNFIRTSPYFRHVYPFDPLVTSSMMFREQNVTIMPVSSSTTGIISMNVMAGILDEMNFMQKVLKSKSQNAEIDGSYSQARQIYNTISRRRRTRFGRNKKLPGVLFLISSSRFPDDFTETKAAESTLCGGDDPLIYVKSTSTWEGQGRHKFSEEEFQVMVGNTMVSSRVLEPGEEAIPGLSVINVPLQYKGDFLKDIDGALHDYAGVTTLSTRPFITNRAAIYQCIQNGQKEGYVNPFERESYCLSYGIPRPDKSKLKLDIKTFRAAHVDLGWKRDAAGIAIGHLVGQKLIEKSDVLAGTKIGELLPIIGFDTIMRVTPPPGGEIEFSHIRRLLVMLRDEYDLPIEYVTFDGFNCVSGDTNILTERGMVRAKDIVVGDTVQSRIGPRAVTNKWAFGKRKALRIITDHGHEIVVTHNHKLEARIGYRYPKVTPGRRKNGGRQTTVPVWGWVKASDLKVGCHIRTWDGDTDIVGQDPINLKYVAGQRHTEFKCPRVLDENFAEFLGLIWGDGWVHKDFVHLTVHSHEKDDAERLFNNVLGCKVHVRRKKNSGNLLTLDEYADCYELIFHSRAFSEFLRINGFVKKYDELPVFITQSNKYVQAAFIRGLFSADGSVKKRDGQPSFSTKSVVWARYIQDFLRMAFGIGSCLTKSKRGASCLPSDNEYQYILSVQGSRQEFIDHIGFCYGTKQGELLRHVNVKGRRILTKVKEIQECEDDVYDFEVEDDHAYLANGFVSHNSIDSRQIMRKLGFKSDHESVEDLESYRSLRDGIYDQRLLFFEHQFLANELAGLEYSRTTSGRDEKVDHRQNACFDGDTRIVMHDGSTIPIRDLVGVDTFRVPSFDHEQNKFVIRDAGNAHIAKYVTELVEVILDNGAIVRCTPDHPFMLTDGSYKEAQYLTQDDELKSLQTKVDDTIIR